MHRFPAFAIAFLFVTLFASAIGADEAAFEFSPTNNPAAGLWGYGWATAPGAAYQAFTTHATAANGVALWSAPNGAALGLACNGANDPGTTWLPGALTARLGSGGAATVLRWTAPSSGNWHVRAGLISGNGYLPAMSGAVPINGTESGAAFGSAVAVGDVNGDGYADVVVGEPNWNNGQTNEGRISLYLGGASGWSTTPAWSVEYNTAGAFFGTSVTVGDFDGDGYADIAAGAPGATFGVVRFYRGTSSTPVFVGQLQGHVNPPTFGNSCLLADFNGDGRADLVVGEPGTNAITYVAGNAAASLGSPVNVVISNGGGSSFAAVLADAGDVNGDGYHDLLIGEPHRAPNDVGAAYILRGSASGLRSGPLWQSLIGATVNGEFGSAVAAAGDLDHDGFADFVVGAPAIQGGGTGHVYLYRGGSSAATLAQDISGPSGVRFGAALAFVGDANGDGEPDFVVGTPVYTNGQTAEGLVQLFLGTAGATATAGWSMESNVASARLGMALAAGDVNGDGTKDIVMGAPAWSGGTGRAYLTMNAGPPPLPPNRVDARLLVAGSMVAHDSIDTPAHRDTILIAADAALTAGQTIDLELTDLDPSRPRDLVSVDVAIEPTATPTGPQGPVFPLAGQRFVPVVGPKAFEALAYDPLAKKFATSGFLYDACGKLLTPGPDGPGIAWDPVTRQFWNIFFDAGNLRWVVASWDTTSQSLTQVFVIPRVLSVPGTGADTLEDARGLAVDSNAVYVVDAGPTNLVPPANAWFKFSRTGTPLASLKGAGFAVNTLADIVDDVVWSPSASPIAPGRLLVAVEHTGIVVLSTAGALVDTFTWRSQNVASADRPHAFAGLALDPGSGDLYLADNDREQAEHWIRLTDTGATTYLVGDGNPLLLHLPSGGCAQPMMWDSIPPSGTTCPAGVFAFGVAYDSGNQRVYAIDYSSGDLWKADPRTGRGVRVGATNLNSVWGLAYDPGRDRLYGAQQISSANQIWSIDPRTAKPTFLPQVTPYTFDDIAFEPNSAMIYTVASNGANHTLIRIDPTTGAGTVVAPTHATRGLDYDPVRGTLLGIGADDSLWSINLGTGAASFVKVETNDQGWEGLAVVPVQPAITTAVPPRILAPGPALALAVSPSPFVDRARVAFVLGAAAQARVDVFDVSGRLVRRLGAGPFAAGSHVLEWDGRDGTGAPAAAGVYFVRLAAGGRSVMSRIVRLR